MSSLNALCVAMRKRYILSMIDFKYGIQHFFLSVSLYLSFFFYHSLRLFNYLPLWILLSSLWLCIFLSVLCRFYYLSLRCSISVHIFLSLSISISLSISLCLYISISLPMSFPISVPFSLSISLIVFCVLCLSFFSFCSFESFWKL